MRSFLKENKKKAIAVILSLFVLLVLSLIFIPFIFEFRNYQKVTIAQQALEQHNLAIAVKMARELLQNDPDEPEATRIMYSVVSTLYPEGKSRLEWGKRLLLLDTTEVSLIIEVASLHLRFGQHRQALHLLGNVAKPHSTHAEFMSLLAIAHQLTGNYSTGLKIMQQARSLHPEDEYLLLNEAKYLSFSNDRSLWQTLENWPETSPLRGEALTVLLGCLHTRRLETEAGRIFQLIQTDEQIPLEMRIAAWESHWRHCSRIGKAMPLLHESLDALQQEASVSLAGSYRLLRALKALELPKETIQWWSTLTPEVQANSIVTIFYADALIQTQDKGTLRELLRQEVWQNADEFRELMDIYLSESHNAQKRTIRLKLLARHLTAHPKRMIKIIPFCKDWKWFEAYEIFLFSLDEAYPMAQSPLRELHDYFRQKKDARGLLLVAIRAIKRNRQDLPMSNNFALLSLLLGHDTRDAYRVAEENYQSHPEITACVVTYAYSLHHQSLSSEALQVMDRLPLDERQLPTVQFYRSVILTGLGRNKEARAIFENTPIDYLLPEEYNLLDKKF
ncbi:MAG: hypothetical protein AAGH72_01060 [Verrucomicrobiota bacterium]